jgi:hypothetical protein
MLPDNAEIFFGLLIDSEVEATCLSEMAFDFSELHGVILQMRVLFITPL